MKSVYGKLISGFLITILFSFTVSGYISIQNSNSQITSLVKNELHETVNFVYELVEEYGVEEIEEILNSFPMSTDTNVFMLIDNTTFLIYGPHTEIESIEFSTYFEDWNNEPIVRNEKNFITYGDMFELDGHTIQIVAATNVSGQQAVYMNSTLVILGTVFLSGSVIFLVIADIIVKPITRITNATKELSKGNYDIRVNYMGDDEISKLNQGFNQMAQQLAKHEETRQKFISDISHEFQTPLTAIQGFANILKDEELPNAQREKYADIILFHSKRLSSLSKNMLQLTLLENDDLKLEMQNYSLNDQLLRVIEDQINSALVKNIEIQFEPPKKEVFIDGDEHRLEQVWINILSNAIKYTKKDGLITVEIKKGTKYIEVYVEDTGMGMSSEVVSHIFERFYREEKARSIEGNGLGLSIVKSIVELHNGNIDVISDVDVGTTFIVRLPVEKPLSLKDRIIQR